ncbi:SDCCAG3 family protein [Megaselia abdita]
MSDEKFNNDKSQESNQAVTPDKNQAKFEPETTTTTNGETSKKRREENPFSFKHFLSNATASSSNATAVSSSTSSRILDLPLPHSTAGQPSYQSATGARPKVPQSASMSTTLANSGGTASDSLSSKMKRSPRFSSFDSQASLAEAATSSSDQPHPSSSSSQQNYVNPPVEQYDHVQRSYSHYDMDYPRARNVNGHRRISPTNSNNRERTSNPEFAAAALPDFVQDHWMDQWYYKDQQNLNSPPNSPSSPIRIPFMEDFPDVNPQPQTLPDFLSDGPIIHSSGRLADVAAGLPDLDSPDDDSPTLLASRLQLENDRLRREVNEIRLSLAEQTRRNHELERTLDQRNQRNRAEEISSSNRESDEAKKLINKLKQQVKDLTGEMQTLRSENESLREVGAVGGCSSNSSRPRPSRSQELSQELQMAASTAEIHLRQLLSGVENLRVLAATLESMGSTDTSPNQDDFIYNCDDFDN